MLNSNLAAEKERHKKKKTKKRTLSQTTNVATVDADEDKIGIVMPSIHSYIAAIQQDARNLSCVFHKVGKIDHTTHEIMQSERYLLTGDLIR